MTIKKVAILTAGGLAPCLSSAMGRLIERYNKISPETEIICYLDGYKGLLLGDKLEVSKEIRDNAHVLFEHGGSPIGNSRVKLTNVADCMKRGLIQDGDNPLKVAAQQLVSDGVDVLHTIGGDDTNIAAASLAAYLSENNYHLNVVGLPKTVDNDVIPIKQSLGAWTAGEEGARYFANIVAEEGANPRMLIMHEVMGRDCGWLTAYTAKCYQDNLDRKTFLPQIGLSKECKAVHAVYIPEMDINIEQEARRLKKIMDQVDNVNIFISEGAGAKAIVKEMEAAGEEVPRDAFGHVKLDVINTGAWFGRRFAHLLEAEKLLVQKSGYYSRAAPSNPEDLALIKACCDKAVECAMNGISGVIGEDEDQDGKLHAIEFSRIKGGKPFDTTVEWFNTLLRDLGQTV
ncbi:pyrophosphate--fructose-6-phosphate 1-phosphotransferase [Temperatibacter marinus]|uniref:Pyrophosphate--fructose 6-phosphate 1-phosphotransferase n=1 Tax=Temperatibacter marinus TaxID=1456591 RepID=A0AA52EGC4_9PROT|nr:pyrophosphate--fructose-6-phosphate 1-phosphotransferase [Temperatibacter marinus]WND02014.1 pyrophosphate--fructose-6-phosphate 1-phosphotransferase [Temperatibacter marinus]